MLKTFQYRLYPTKSQRKKLDAQLEECRWLYNHFLAERRDTYKATGKGINRYDQDKTLPSLKERRPSLKTVFAQCLQNVCLRVDLAFKAFFRRTKAGEKPGYPRFKQFSRYDSMTFPQAPRGCYLEGGVLQLHNVGDVKINLHRKLRGDLKTCTIRRSSTGKWYANLTCDLSVPKPLPKSKEQVGIDVGLNCFAALSNGEKIKRKRFFKTDEKELAKAQKKLEKVKKGTPERKKLRKPVSRIYERIRFRRQNFAHQTSRRIINDFGFIAVEDLQVNRMRKVRKFSKSIDDVAWSLFFTLLFYKAVEAGRTIVRVNPAYTSQTCHNCGYRQKMPVSIRTFTCECCELSYDRDHNAACNILSLGLQAVGSIPKSSSFG
jgi:putative transposase